MTSTENLNPDPKEIVLSMDLTRGDITTLLNGLNDWEVHVRKVLRKSKGGRPEWVDGFKQELQDILTLRDRLLKPARDNWDRICRED
jgi:hypothetical protein